MRAIPLLLVSFLLLPLVGKGSPVFEGIPNANAANVTPTIPVAKALVVPISVYDDAAPDAQPTITVTSSNPLIYARVKTGNPLLKMHVTHTAPDIDDDLVFQLFDDLTPKTAAYIAGFAQAGYFDGQVFHRIANLSGSTTAPEFIFQGGSPTSTNPATAGTGGPGFQYDNELSAPLIFAGRGQLAMANSGYSDLNRGTNGSQFFITNSPTRELDFGYTIYGQLTHGWSALPKLAAVPRSTGYNSSGVDITDRPVTDVKLTGASVVNRYTGRGLTGTATHTYTDAVLILSAIRPGTSTITVTAGGTTATFTATAEVDSVNDKSFLKPIDDLMTKAENIRIPYQMVDLEYDVVSVSAPLLENGDGTATGSKSSIAAFTPSVLVLAGNPRYKATSSANAGAYTGLLLPSLESTQWRPGYRQGYDAAVATPDNYETPNAAVGTSPVTDDSVVLTGPPGAALTGAVVARFTDSDRLARPAGYTATVNWGDGAAVSDKGLISFSTAPGGYHQLQVSGTHTYARAGLYPLVVTLTGSVGWVKELRGTAIITANKLVATPAVLNIASARVNNRAVATFTDGDQPGPASAYQAVVDWGDGDLSAGVVRLTAPGTYTVYGTHLYRDPEIFPFTVRIHKTGAAAASDAVVWSRLRLSGFAAREHLPPFSQAHVSGLLTPVPLYTFNGNTYYLQPKEIVKRTTGASQTYLSVQLTIRNGGNRIARTSILRMYLARGTTIHKTPVLDASGNQVLPADIPLPFGPSLADPATGAMIPQTTVRVSALAPQQGTTYTFENSALGDFRLRLPAGETGTGYNLIADLDYADTLPLYEPVSQPVYGRIQGIVVTPASLVTTEAGGSGTFTVVLDRQPLADVTIPLTGDSTEGRISPSSVTFTPANWFTPQNVTVTGLPDSGLASAGGTGDRSNVTYTITLGAAQSADALYQGLIPPSVSVTNVDRDSNITIGATAGTQDPGPTASTAPTLATTAPSGTGTISLTLRQKPAAAVTVQVLISNAAEGKIVQKGTTTAGSTTVTFLPAEFATNNSVVKKSIYLQSLQDSANAGKTITYTVEFQASSTDPNFSGITPVPVTVRNTNP